MTNQVPNYGNETVFSITSPVYMQEWDGTITEKPNSEEDVLLLFNGTQTSCTILFTGDSVIGDKIYFKTPESLYCIFCDDDGGAIYDVGVVIHAELSVSQTIEEIAYKLNKYNDLIIGYTATTLTITSKAGGLTQTPSIFWTNANITDAIAGTGNWGKIGKVHADIVVNLDGLEIGDSEKETNIAGARIEIKFDLLNVTSRAVSIASDWNNKNVNIAFFDETNSKYPVAVHHNLLITTLPDIMNKECARIKFRATKQYKDWDNYIKFFQAPYDNIITYTQFLQDIDDLRDNPTADFTLLRPLDFKLNSSYNQADPDWQAKKLAWTTGTGWTPIGAAVAPYTGNFDGGGFTISNFYINEPSSAGADYASFFGVTDKATIQNLTVSGSCQSNNQSIGMLIGNSTDTIITNCHTIGDIKGLRDVGGFIGYSVNDTITECSARVNVTAYVDSYGPSGGFIGSAPNTSIISKCFSIGDVNAATAAVLRVVGGFIGGYGSCTISDCYHIGAVTSNSCAGFAGYGSGNISNCYHAGAVVSSVTGRASGCVSIATGIITSCYYDVTLAPNYVGQGYGTGKTTAEMKQEATYTDWDFTTIWDIVEDVSYPTLR